ncbi:cytochrome P450 6k1-like [Phymastichus coffea]|uniref:cytochrome P450 6k1-like n=1 Tax=Phymastichus coffea TaxID=108790 RepID=UPI00273B0605|nr:cytochrome P450 6k1-like [Phymastichus coffea]
MESFFIVILTVLVMLFYIVCYYFTRNFDYWKKRSVAGPKPLPFFGTFKDTILSKIHMADYLKSIYDVYPNDPMIGLFSRTTPFLLVKDPELVKDVLIKSFMTFRNRGITFHADLEPLAQNLFFLEYKRWKPLRRKLTPVFTSGKLKEMFYLIDECTQHFVNCLEKLAITKEPIECREITAKFTTDVIGVCVYGLNLNAMKDENSDFRKIGRELFADNWSNRIRINTRIMPHWFAALFKPIVTNQQTIDFFVNTIMQTIEYRKKNNIRRNDFIDNLRDIREHPEQVGEEKISDVLLSAQAFAFFVAGFETSSTTISNAMYELALNPAIQDILRDEINKVTSQSGGKLNYESIKNMKYLDKVFQETLRKYPPAFIIIREASDDHLFDKNGISITKGTRIFISVYSIHHDPNIYPDPEKFDPERFTEEAVKLRSPMTFLPFGDGPRNCIGERFAHLQTKLGLAAAVKHFKRETCEKTNKVYKKKLNVLLLAPEEVDSESKRIMEICSVEILVGLVALLYVVYHLLTWNFDYWEKRQVVGPKPKPLYGTFEDITLESVHDVNYIKSIYDAYPGQPAVGLFKRSNPVLLLRDPDLIKDVLIKNFQHFSNRGNETHKSIAPLASHLFFLKYKEWKPMRTVLSPTFTSGKLKEMFYLITECTEHFVNYIGQLAEKNEPIECREMNAKFTTDVIGICAFGLNMNSMADEDSDFRKMGRKIFDRSIMNRIRRIVNKSYNWIRILLSPLIVDRELVNFFVNCLNETIKYRKENGVRRNDFVDLLINVRDHPEKLGDGVELTDLLLTCQAFVFFAAGFETSSSTLSNAMYELALHPEIQNRLRDDVTKTFEKNNGKLNYDSIIDMKYLDKVFKETLRKYPPVFSLTREATSDHTFVNSKLSITKGTSIIIPAYAIQHDPTIYPNPEQFNPERFEEQEVKSRRHMTYLPFGDGPRNCIGERFAYIQTKLGLAYAIKNFEFQVCDKTPRTFRTRPATVILSPIDPLYLTIKKVT